MLALLTVHPAKPRRRQGSRKALCAGPQGTPKATEDESRALRRRAPARSGFKKPARRQTAAPGRPLSAAPVEALLATLGLRLRTSHFRRFRFRLHLAFRLRMPNGAVSWPLCNLWSMQPFHLHERRLPPHHAHLRLSSPPAQPHQGRPAHS